MSIVTLDQALAGMQYGRQFMKAATPTLVAGRLHSLFYLGGHPGAGVAPTPGIGGEVLTTLLGQIPFTNPVSGNTYLARLQGMATIGGTLMLCDRLWQNSGLDVTSTAEQVFAGHANIPTRDALGAANGVEVYAAVEVSTVTGAGTPTLTLKYTNSAGATGHTAIHITPAFATSAVGSFYPIGLAAGDLGIQTAESLTLSATWTSGVIHVVLYRVIARLELTSSNVPNAIDALTSGFPRLWNDTVPFLIFIPSTTTISLIAGEVRWTQG
jgi:hypothetical protein